MLGHRLRTSGIDCRKVVGNKLHEEILHVGWQRFVLASISKADANLAQVQPGVLECIGL